MLWRPRVTTQRTLGLRRLELVLIVVIVSLSLVLMALAFQVFYTNGRAALAPALAESSEKLPFMNRVMPARKQEESAKLQETIPEGMFLPGSLQITGIGRGEILAMCHVPDDTMSKKHKLIYHMTPKAGSSTGRHVVKNDFDGVDFTHGCQVPRGEDASQWTQVATLRNPVSRAFASYEEMFVRRLGFKDKIPDAYRRFMEPFQGYSYPNYSALFDQPAGVARLTRAYEQFMRDWDGRAFDMHLERQVPYNVRRHGSAGGRLSSKHLSLVFDTHKMKDAFEFLAIQKKLDHVPQVIHGRAYPRRMNVSDVSDDAMQAMCRVYAIDFCCLNYELPPACLRAPPGRRVLCKWLEKGGERLIDSVTA